MPREADPKEASSGLPDGMPDRNDREGPEADIPPEVADAPASLRMTERYPEDVLPDPEPGERSAIMREARRLYPGYFSMVMATGVVSMACEFLGLRWIALPLIGISWAAYLVLWGLTLIRLIWFPRRIALDLSTHYRAPGFFTLVAGTCVLGTQSVVVLDAWMTGFVLWHLGLALWGVVMYAFFTAVTIRGTKPSLAAGINGAWLIAAVATQSVVVLRAVLNADSAPPEAVQVLCLSFFMIGCMLYLAIIPLIFYRLTFSQLAAQDFGPPYWINMGAAAITTLSGALLVGRGDIWPVIGEFVPIIRGFTIFFWSAASWWIPFLASLMVWRYVIRRDPPRYEPQLWGMVFPLGMYTTSTLQLGWKLPLPAVLPIPELFIYVALAAWSATFIGLLFTLARA
ncbi:MAG TPA: tellurite resistance/C4-dicarboxylate transporter family protein [Paracoccaceae bacterium]|nr:tellurite resistance/C4-dicarboxylate transporter family protein [Paracoccaceae bacterium]